MISVRLSPPEEFPEVVREFRTDICRCSGTAPVGAEIESVPHALYLFAFMEDDSVPGGMLEFLFMGEAYRKGQCPRMGAAVVDSGIAPIDDVIHVRSLAVRETKQNSRVLTVLCHSFVNLALSMGARALTAAHSVGNKRSANLQRKLGMTRLATMNAGGDDVELSYLDLTAARERAKSWQRHRPVIHASPGLSDRGCNPPSFASGAEPSLGLREFRINQSLEFINARKEEQS